MKNYFNHGTKVFEVIQNVDGLAVVRRAHIDGCYYAVQCPDNAGIWNIEFNGVTCEEFYPIDGEYEYEYEREVDVLDQVACRLLYHDKKIGF